MMRSIQSGFPYSVGLPSERPSERVHGCVSAGHQEQQVAALREHVEAELIWDFTLRSRLNRYLDATRRATRWTTGALDRVCQVEMRMHVGG